MITPLKTDLSCMLPDTKRKACKLFNGSARSHRVAVVLKAK